ncbi:MAG: TrmH family RNA methyltransferase [Caldilineaceae bacterium]
MTSIDRCHPALQMMECTSEGCGLRYPQAIRAQPLAGCPRCGGPVRVAAQYASAQQTQQTFKSHSLTISLLLDNIRSAHNVGSMLRTADGAGVQHVYLCGVTPTPEHARVHKTALGAEQLLPWSYHANGAKLAVHLKTENHLLYAIEGSGDAVSLFEEPSIDGKTHGVVLVIGNEISGVDPGILAQCARRWFLPMLGGKRSLNVAVACGIALYHLRYVARG